jgi:hypothetical protein
MKHLWGIAFVLEGAGYLNVDLERPENAALLLGCAQSLRTAIGFPLSPAYHDEHANYLARLQRLCTQDQYEEWWRRGAALSWQEVTEIVLQL